MGDVIFLGVKGKHHSITRDYSKYWLDLYFPLFTSIFFTVFSLKE